MHEFQFMEMGPEPFEGAECLGGKTVRRVLALAKGLGVVFPVNIFAKANTA
ncbi:MAG: hypothetical protein R8G34_08960 [Paracoccaceae bacterium]|nr:hypothetical protein [Paracoccaceae bacterium]